MYSRPVPPEWPELVACARSVLVPESTMAAVAVEQVAQVVRVVNQLDNEALTANRFYGLGLGMLPFAKELARPDRYSRVVALGAWGLAWAELLDDEHLRTAPLCIRDLARQTPEGDSVMDKPFQDIAARTCSHIPLPEHLVTNALTYLNRHRHAQLSSKSMHSVLEAPELYTRIASMRGVEEDLGKTAITSARMLLVHALCKHGGTNDRDIPIQDIVNAEELQRLLPVSTGRKGMLLRLWDFLDDNLVASLCHDVNGEMHLEASGLISHPPELTVEDLRDNTKGVIRLKRYGCPALHVEGLASDIIGALVAIVVAADKLRGAGRQA